MLYYVVNKIILSNDEIRERPQTIEELDGIKPLNSLTKISEWMNEWTKELIFLLNYMIQFYYLFALMAVPSRKL